VELSGSFTPTDPTLYQYVNLASVKIRGIEGKTEIELGRGFELTAAAAYAHGNSRSEGVEQPLASIEPLKVVAGLDWAAANDRYGAELFDIVAWWKPIDSLGLRAGVFNLTNEKYWWWSDVRGLAATSGVTDAYSQPGRNVSVSVSMAF
jgi:hemoglobin/transferrin/lactoferrin receptor protein